MDAIKELYRLLCRKYSKKRIKLDGSSQLLTVTGKEYTATVEMSGNIIRAGIEQNGALYSILFAKTGQAFSFLDGLADGTIRTVSGNENPRFIFMKYDRSALLGLRYFSSLSYITLLSAALLAGIFVIPLTELLSKHFHFPSLTVLPTLIFLLLCTAAAVKYIRKDKKSSKKGAYKGTYVLSRVYKLPPQEDIDRLFIAVRERTMTDAISMKLDRERAPELTESKIGGIPYWDMTLPYPADENGGKLVLLAQIRLCELPENDIFPADGMLQFFLRADNTYGLDFDGKTDGYRVVFHKNVSESVTAEDILSLGISTSLDTEEFPVNGEFAVNFSKKRVPMTDEDVRFDDVIENTAGELGIVSESYCAYDIFDEIQRDSLRQESLRHGMLGYPGFVQCDPRGTEEAERYDTLLFQLDSEWDHSQPLKYRDRQVMWGDAGIGNFFINSQALAGLDFSDVLLDFAT